MWALSPHMSVLLCCTGSVICDGAGKRMIQKRFTVAAAELSGCIYATGGYDSEQYLSTVERYDPREGRWSPVRFLAGHSCSVVVLLVILSTHVLQNEHHNAMGHGVAVTPTHWACCLPICMRLKVGRDSSLSM